MVYFVLFSIFPHRNGISFKSIVGESKSVTPEMVAPWNETTLPTLLSNYKLEDIYNADEFGLFYQCLPNKTLHLQSEKCSGGKHSKVRLTGMAAASANGEKLPMFVIGKSRKPRCFKNIRHLPCRYRSQKKSWMNSDLFEEWVKELDRRFKSENRNVVLIVDNCPAHPRIDHLANLKLIFLPPNTTSVSQPMDQGVIRSLKAHYRRRAVQMLIRSLDRNEPLPKISVLHAMKLIVASWNAVSKQTIVNCFKKAGISDENQVRCLSDEDDPFKNLDDELEVLRSKDPDLITQDVTSETLTSIDEHVITTEPIPSDADILAEYLQSDDNEDESDDEREPQCPSQNEVSEALELLQNLALFSSRGEEMQNSVLKLQSIVQRDILDKKKQKSITSYFVKSG